ncbi:hypothetical protein FHR99_003223 [Litorivivens lipolytica]|uniref:Uncharacterized protein n=1 Tax=Litorivivens lipolytica TaxID=1524264 RepID=A0A7W4Z6W5_9GAMM|nr:hypothetical protein [Litorivivens lipolytica]MBB3048949.1 hypothetical protein [Litorivivens lipolytica]
MKRFPTSSAAVFTIAIVVAVIALYLTMGAIVLFTSEQPISALSLIAWLGSSGINSDTIGSTSNSISVILGIPTALLGTMFALVIAERAHRVSKQTRDLAARAEQIQQRQNRIELLELLESRFKPTIHLLNRLDAELEALHYLGVTLKLYHRTHYAHRGDSDDRIHLAEMRALPHHINRLLAVLEAFQHDPVARDILNRCWSPRLCSHAEIPPQERTPLLASPIHKLMSALAGYQHVGFSALPHTLVNFHGPEGRLEAFMGLLFLGWVFTDDHDALPQVAGQKPQPYKANPIGLLLTDLWHSLPTKEALLQLFDDYRYGALAEVDKSLLDNLVVSTNYAPLLAGLGADDNDVIAGIEYLEGLMRKSKRKIRRTEDIVIQRRTRALYMDYFYHGRNGYVELEFPVERPGRPLTEERLKEMASQDTELYAQAGYVRNEGIFYST